MKIKLLTIFFYILSLSLQAQPTHYQFTHRSDSYVPLPETAVTLNDSTWSNEDEFAIPVPFPLFMFNEEVEKIVLAGGCIYATSVNAPNIEYGLLTQSPNLVDAGYYLSTEDVGDLAGASSLKYLVEGVEGQRIFKVEINNAASIAEWALRKTNLMTINYQLWFYEENQEIEVWYGPHSVTDFDLFFDEQFEEYEEEDGDEEFLSPFFTVILAKVYLDDWGFDMELLQLEMLTGTVENPILISNIEYDADGIASYPDSGRVFHFGRNLHSPKFAELNFELYPNPAVDYLTVVLDEIPREQRDRQYEIVNSVGQRVLSGTLRSDREQIDVQSLNAGIYFIKVADFKPKKIMKK